jgi:hypothetical protein
MTRIVAAGRQPSKTAATIKTTERKARLRFTKKLKRPTPPVKEETQRSQLG